MKIGLLAYHFASNFGAVLQLLSTYMYLQHHGHTPIIINYIPADLQASYLSTTPPAQVEAQRNMRRQLWHETELCRNDADIARVIEHEHIDAVIIGSDAVMQHHPLLERVAFPCRTIVGLTRQTSDQRYPNPFWATWQSLLSRKVNFACMSASCQDSRYRLATPSARRGMGSQLMKASYVSVRDEWTRGMVNYLTRGCIDPPITPDPVFAFNQNAAELIPSHQAVLQKFHLPERYVLVSFLNTSQPTMNQQWLNRFCELMKQQGLTPVKLPYAHADAYGRMEHSVPFPLTPLEWYALIKYSAGYVGNNMHPIVISLHNSVPFYSFDTYGTRHFNGLTGSDRSSKIKLLLHDAGLDEQRCRCLGKRFTLPRPELVADALLHTNREKEGDLAARYLDGYNLMMHNLLNSLAR